MKVSVIIPFHRGDAYLRDCLDSLREDAYQDKEIIVISDHAPKEELQILQEYEQDLDIKLYHLKNKKGVAAARNLGLDNATGDYIYFIDSDDYLYGNTIETLVLAAQDRDDDIVYGKKKSTWFQRSVFLARKLEKELEESEDDSEDNSSEEGQNFAENGEMNDKDRTDGNSDENSDDHEDEENESESREDRRSSKESDGEEIREEDLRKEEREKLIRKRVKVAYRVLVSKRKGVKSLSVLNILFKRSFVEEHKLRFTEDLKYFSDASFLLEALTKTDKFKKRLAAQYIKRKHNDSINFPSLSQVKDSKRFDELVDTYYDCMKRIPEDSPLRYTLERKYINYYASVFAPKMKRSPDNVWRTKHFHRMGELFSNFSKQSFRGYSRYKKRLAKAAVKKDLRKSLVIIKAHLAHKKIKRILRSKKALAKTLYIHWFLKMPVKQNSIMFESFFGKNYSDSPKYIYEYISKNYPKEYKSIWVIDKKNTKIPFAHKRIKRFSIRYYYYLARCQYFVFNSRQPEWAVKREESTFLQTWHGTPLKKLVFDMEDITSASPKYKKQVYNQSRAWDYLIAPNAFCSETFRRCFMFENEMLETGYPRNDILHAANRMEIAEKIKSKLGIPKNKKTILYAPTWRDDEYYGKGQYKFDLHLDLRYLKEQIGDEYVILLRTHYFIADALDVTGLEGFAFNMSKYDDISELYLISDVLITDYSSVFFDYANLKRPMLFFTYDLEKYRDVLRGFYIDIENEVPGPLVFTSEEVADAIKNIKEIEQEYKTKYDEFYHRFCEWEDGHASQKVVESVFRK